MRVHGYSFFLIALLFGCAQQNLANNGICKTGDGDVNTYRTVGAWKRIPVTEEEKLNTTGSNYRLLYFMPGGVEEVLSGGTVDGIDIYYSNRICERVISAPSAVRTVKAGVYFNDDGHERLRVAIVDLEDNETEPTVNWVEYSFSGSCNDTIMTLRYKSAGGQTIKKDRFQFFSNVVGADACD